MIDILLGALLMAGVWAVTEYVRKRQIHLLWWHWLLTILGILYVAFVLKVSVDFIAEGAPTAALVMGGILGLIAVIWGTLLARFVFKPAK